MKLNFKDKELLHEANEVYKNLPTSVKEFLSDRILISLYDKLIEIDQCESPIEQLFGIALSEIMPKTLEVIAQDAIFDCQRVIECKDKKYRVDFFVAVRYRDVTKGYVIECDGHNFHEKTKEQAKKDKERDRNLMASGYPVIRFTGSEIFENPIICAREAMNIIIENLLSGD